MTSCSLFVLITVSVFNDLPPLVLVRSRLVKFCKYSRRLMCFWIPCVFSELTFPTRVCWIISLRVFLEDLFVFPSGLFFPAYLASRDQVYVRVFLPVRGSLFSQFWTLP